MQLIFLKFITSINLSCYVQYSMNDRHLKFWKLINPRRGKHLMAKKVILPRDLRISQQKLAELIGGGLLDYLDST